MIEDIILSCERNGKMKETREYGAGKRVRIVLVFKAYYLRVFVLPVGFVCCTLFVLFEFGLSLVRCARAIPLNGCVVALASTCRSLSQCASLIR